MEGCREQAHTFDPGDVFTAAHPSPSRGPSTWGSLKSPCDPLCIRSQTCLGSLPGHTRHRFPSSAHGEESLVLLYRFPTRSWWSGRPGTAPHTGGTAAVARASCGQASHSAWMCLESVSAPICRHALCFLWFSSLTSMSHLRSPSQRPPPWCKGSVLPT